MQEKNTHIEEPKTQDELRAEVAQEFGWDESDADEKAKIDKVVGLRVDRYTATKQKRKAEERKEHYKKLAGVDPKTGKPISKGNPKEKPVEDVVAEQVFLQGGGTKTALRQIHKIMAGTGKTFAQAKTDSLFLFFQEQEKARKRSEDGQLGASHGGGSGKKIERKLDSDEEGFMSAMGAKK